MIKNKYKNILHFQKLFCFFVQWLEMDFRVGCDCFLCKFSETNVEKTIKKRPKRRSNMNKEPYM